MASGSTSTNVFTVSACQMIYLKYIIGRVAFITECVCVCVCNELILMQAVW